MSAPDDFNSLNLNDLPGEEPTEEFNSEEGPPPEEMPIGRKKVKINSSTLLMFGLLAAVCGATYLMVIKAGQQDQAFGAVLDNPNALKADSTLDIRKTMGMMRNMKAVVADLTTYSSAHQVPANELRTNPFTAPQFRSLADTPTADDNQEAERREAAEQVVRGLKLQSIIFGSRSVCMIDGRPYGVGEGSKMFTVVKILPQAVVLRVGPGTFELKIDPPPQE